MAIERSEQFRDVLRQAFYSELLDTTPVRPEKQFENICQAWIKATNGKWAWLWLFNSFTKEWEIRHVTSVHTTNHVASYTLPTLTSPHNRTVTAYAAAIKQPVFVNDFNWSGDYENTTYVVACKSELIQMGCKEFITVPFYSTVSGLEAGRSSDDRFSPSFFGAMCIHSDETNALVRHPESSLMLMGAMTANAITTAYQSVKLRTAAQLTELAEEVLTIQSRDINAIRQYYLDRLTRIIIDTVKVKAVSIFYHDQYYSKVNCIATTGICGRDGNPVPESRLHRVSYPIGQGRTGRCFQTGAIDVFSSGVAASHDWTWSEMLEGRQVGKGGAVICPIPRLAVRKTRQDKPTDAKSHGVVRCSQREIFNQSSLERPFDQITVHLLWFIARQIGAVLETLNAKDLREQTISVVKHDLYAPLEMIRHTSAAISDAAEVSRAKERTIQLGQYDLPNLQSAALLAAHYVGELDLDPISAASLTIEQAYLMNSIVARISNMLNHVAEQDNGMKIEFHGFEQMPKLWIDVAKVERVFVNVLMNAIKYGEENTVIRVRAYSPFLRDDYRIDISNKGDGVLPEDADRIFDLGFRSDRARRRRQGVGLGLFISRAIMSAHQGKLLLAELKDPTTFSIVFPSSLRFENWRDSRGAQQI